MAYFKLVLVGLMILSSWQTLADEEPVFENSVVSNDIDFIHSDDPTEKSVIKYLGTSSREMPDERSDSLFDESAHVFVMTFADGAVVEILLHSDFKDAADIEHYSNMLAGPVGKLPFKMRTTLSHVVVHKGNLPAFSEHLGHFFVLYSQNMETRIGNNDLEETVFHEAVHATLDHEYRDTIKWKNAQKTDGVFVTRYGARNPDAEDFAESALFAYTLIRNPSRFSAELQSWLMYKIPNRIMYFYDLFSEIDAR